MNAPRPAMPLLLSLALLPTGCFGTCGPFEEPRFYEETGCVDEEAPEEPTLLVGTTEGQAFTEMTDGEALLIDYGPQGGQHFYVSARVAGALPEDLVVLTLDGEPSAQSFSVVPECAQGWAELENMQLEVPTDEERSDTLRVRVVRCETPGCDRYAQEGENAPTVIAEEAIAISVVQE
jgi:hypothetical protein